MQIVLFHPDENIARQLEQAVRLILARRSPYGGAK